MKPVVNTIDHLFTMLEERFKISRDMEGVLKELNLTCRDENYWI
jgi:hypothetical protein